MTIGEGSDDVLEEPIQSVLTRLERDHARTLAIVARFLEEYDVPGLAKRLADDGIDLPLVGDIHGDRCLCATCRPDDGTFGRMVTN